MAKKRVKPKPVSPARTDIETHPSSSVAPSPGLPDVTSPGLPDVTSPDATGPECLDEQSQRSSSVAAAIEPTASEGQGQPSTDIQHVQLTTDEQVQADAQADASPWSSIKLVAVTVSVDYHGELMVALPRLTEVCDRVVLVTDIRDELTREIAEAYGCKLLLSRNFKTRGAKFNKAEAVHIGQKAAHSLLPDSWYLVVDSDIVIPRDLKKTIYEECVDPKALYGMTRLDYDTPEQYASHTPIGEYKHKSAGYFQLYSRTDLLYPPWSESAAQCDISFARKFSRHALLSGYCHHLGVKHVNWQGRVAPPWLATQEAIDGE